MMNITPLVKQLLIINVIFFIGAEFVGQGAIDLLAMYYPENPQFQIWQVLTHMFMHGGLMHIAFNMFALYSFGSNLEHIWGSQKFLFFYISCGLGAALLHEGVNWYLFQDGMKTLVENGQNKAEVMQILAEGKFNSQWQQILSPEQFQSFIGSYMIPVVGASGAIYGLLVAFAYMFPNAELMMIFLPIPIKAKYFVPAILLLDLFLGVSGKSIFGGGGGIAHFAHIGGAAVGFLMMLYWKKNQFNDNRWN